MEGKSPHKPQIDQVKIKCSKCGEVTSRIEPVGNPWLDAGIVPFLLFQKIIELNPCIFLIKKNGKSGFQ